jgi:hypothetical protein
MYLNYIIDQIHQLFNESGKKIIIAIQTQRLRSLMKENWSHGTLAQYKSGGNVVHICHLWASLKLTNIKTSTGWKLVEDVHVVFIVYRNWIDINIKSFLKDKIKKLRRHHSTTTIKSMKKKGKWLLQSTVIQVKHCLLPFIFHNVGTSANDLRGIIWPSSP